MVGKINRIMLDNFTPQTLRQNLTDGMKRRPGGDALNNIEGMQQPGLIFISSGAIIHQARSLDLSLRGLPFSNGRLAGSLVFFQGPLSICQHKNFLLTSRRGG
jgi:hypothetical protein